VRRIEVYARDPRGSVRQVVAAERRNGWDEERQRRTEDSDKYLCLVLDGLVRVTVQDEGTGMSQETLKRAGEPFYTTKEAGAGFGLGLFLARVFTERVGGTLTFESGRGTTATLDVPSGREESL
jgi:signal transduction histidine kinase